MRRLRGRRLHPEPSRVDGGCDADDCWPLPWTTATPAPAPAPAPPPIVHASPNPCPPPPPSVPSPAPVRSAGGSRRDQGRATGSGSPPPTNAGGGGNPHHTRLLIKSAVGAAAAIAFISLILLGISVLIRRRQVRRRRQALLAVPAAAAPPGPPTDFDDPEFGGGGGGGGVVHHVWYIRTVGLDEAAIESIAATRYRAGAGLLGAADCTVCLGEFQDGELVRLLPKCGHAFHVPCIDTWLRAHVNCPLCRSDVLDPAVTTDTAGGGESGIIPPADDPVEDNNSAAVEQEEDATSEAMSEHGQEGNGNQQEEALPAVEDHRQFRLPEQPPPQLPRPLPHNVRRVVSMDAALVATAADVAAALERLPEAAPEEEHNGRRKRGTGASSVKPSDSGIPRSFFLRHCRTRSSVSRF